VIRERFSCYEMRMRGFVSAIVLTGSLLVACKHDVTEDLQALESRACECAAKKDAACGKAVLGDLAKLGEIHNAKADEAKAAESAKHLATCRLDSGVKALEIHEALTKPEEPAEKSN